MTQGNDARPARLEERGNSRAVARADTLHRAVALLGQAFDILAKQAAAGKGDFAAVLAAQLLEDPLTGLERIAKLIPPEPAATGGANPLLNIGNLYLGAARAMAEHRTAGAAPGQGDGIQPGYIDAQAIDVAW